MGLRCSWYTAPRMAVRMERTVKNVRIVAVKRSVKKPVEK
jgi:hypothetical protein